MRKPSNLRIVDDKRFLLLPLLLMESCIVSNVIFANPAFATPTFGRPSKWLGMSGFPLFAIFASRLSSMPFN